MQGKCKAPCRGSPSLKSSGFGLRPSSSKMPPPSNWAHLSRFTSETDCNAFFFSNFFFPWTGARVSLQEKVCFSLCPNKTPNLPSYLKRSKGRKKKKSRGRLYTPDLSYFSLQKTIFEYYVIEPPCLMTLLMHCYQVVPSVFGQMCSLVCLLSINYLYLKFNGSYIYLDICT